MSARAVSANRLRDTPGRVLLGWAMLMTPLVILSWRVHLHPGDFDWVEYPTGLGDSRIYKPMEADLFAPNLRIQGHPEGLFRRDREPQSMEDATMTKVSMDESGTWFIYMSTQPELSGRVFLKTGQGRYVEFGARAHYQPFVPPVSTRNP